MEELFRKYRDSESKKVKSEQLMSTVYRSSAACALSINGWCLSKLRHGCVGYVLGK